MKKHPDLEFHVELANGQTRVLDDFNEALALAASESIGMGRCIRLDVVCWSAGAAATWGGDDALERYNEDPDASIHERLWIEVSSEGTIP